MCIITQLSFYKLGVAMFNDKDYLQENRYKLLINARDFHQNSFNKWMTFFYVAIGALFVGYYNILTKNEDYFFQEIIIIVVGLVISIFWYWSCKGHYYWVIQFIKLIMEYEKNYLPIELRVYSCMANKKLNNNYFNPLMGANISTAKITLLFSFFIIFIWDILLVKSILKKLVYTHICCYILFVILSMTAIYLRISVLPIIIKSDISKHDELNLE